MKTYILLKLRLLFLLYSISVSQFGDHGGSNKLLELLLTFQQGWQGYPMFSDENSIFLHLPGIISALLSKLVI